MAKVNLNAPELYVNRELSWLEFNDRVMQEGLSDSVPLMERLKFLAIVSSNLDEFFLIRVAGLRRQRAAGVRKRDIAGMTPAQQLRAISQRTHRMVAEQTAGIRRALEELARHSLVVLEREGWTDSGRRYLRSHFSSQVLPVLTPLAMDELQPRPLLPGLQLHVAVLVASPKDHAAAPRLTVIPVPTQLPRFVTLPAEPGDRTIRLVPLEDVIADNAEEVLPGGEVVATATFRITRDADVEIQDDDASDLLAVVQQAVLARRRRSAVRLEISARPDRRIKKWLADWLELTPDDIYEINGILDARALGQIAGLPGFDHLRLPEWPPQPPADLAHSDDLWQTLQERDVLLFHPYESFDPVIELVQKAAEDPHVLAIKQTLYRTSGDSPIVRALERAAQNGKEVTALVELKARFDETRNVHWARRLEDAGCHVVYGIAGYKTHAKALLVVRREPPRVRRYVHLATGNYNDQTARLYSDIGLLTTNRDLAADVGAFFNLLTGFSEAVGWSQLTVEPHQLKRRFVQLIQREKEASSADQPGLIMAKINSLEDPDICQALYRASRAGVRVMLNVRGICCLRPGLPGYSETIEVRSIVDRFLEHARIFYFRNGGHEEVYLSSADWMRRNLERRLEILFPVTDPGLRRRLIKILKTCFADNVKARCMKPDGSYEPVQADGPRIRAQEEFYQEAVEAARAAQRTTVRFRPLRRPREP